MRNLFKVALFTFIEIGAQFLPAQVIYSTSVSDVLYETGEHYASKASSVLSQKAGSITDGVTSPDGWLGSLSISDAFPGRIGVGTTGSVSNGQAKQFTNLYVASYARSYMQDSLIFYSAKAPPGAILNERIDFRFEGESHFVEFLGKQGVTQISGFDGYGPRFSVSLSSSLGGKTITQFETGSPFGLNEWNTPQHGLMQFDIRIPNGGKLSMGIQGSVGGFALTYGERSLGASYNLDYADTLAWDGVVSSTDQFGDVLNDVLISAGSGANYNDSLFEHAPDAVPEPGAYSALGMIVLFCAILVKRQQTSRVSI